MSKSCIDTRISALLWLGIAVSVGFAAVIFTLDHKNGKAVEAALAAQERATHVAFEAAEAKGVQHNGLIDRMREMSATFVTRGNVYSAILAAAAVSGIYFGFAR